MGKQGRPARVGQYTLQAALKPETGVYLVERNTVQYVLKLQPSSDSPEILALSKARHHNIVRLEDVLVDETKDGPRHFAVLEYAGTLTLAHFCPEYTFEEPKALALTAQIASALEHNHQNHFIYNDMSPGNVCIGTGIPKLIDFSCCTNTAESHPGIQGSTPGMRCAEQVLGYSSTACDVFGAGSLLYLMIQGRAPYLSQETIAMCKHLDKKAQLAVEDRDEIEALRNNLELKCLQRPYVPAKLDDKQAQELLHAMLAYNPADRPSMREVGSTLAGYLN